MDKYKGNEERPLSELIENRKKYHITKLERALDAAYKNRDIEYIEQIERIVSLLSDGKIGDLERILSKQTSKQSPQKTPDKRPRLTRYQYRTCRNEGMSNEDIKKKFRTDNPYQINGFALQYAQAQKREGKNL